MIRAMVALHPAYGINDCSHPIATTSVKLKVPWLQPFDLTNGYGMYQFKHCLDGLASELHGYPCPSLSDEWKHVPSNIDNPHLSFRVMGMNTQAARWLLVGIARG